MTTVVNGLQVRAIRRQIEKNSEFVSSLKLRRFEWFHISRDDSKSRSTLGVAMSYIFLVGHAMVLHINNSIRHVVDALPEVLDAKSGFSARSADVLMDYDQLNPIYTGSYVPFWPTYETWGLSLRVGRCSLLYISTTVRHTGSY